MVRLVMEAFRVVIVNLKKPKKNTNSRLINLFVSSLAAVGTVNLICLLPVPFQDFARVKSLPKRKMNNSRHLFNTQLRIIRY